MARVTAGSRPVAIDPLKHSQPLGGALAMLGIARCMPLLHGTQGCTAFAKALLTRHFREPIPLQTTALTEVSAVVGATGSLHAALDTIAARHRPELIAVLTTGVPELSGEDLDGALRECRADLVGDGPGPAVVAVSTPDFRGGLSDGWSAALKALVAGALAAGPGASSGRGGVATEPAGSAAVGGGQPWGDVPDLVAVPVGVSLTAADLDEISDLVAAFGLRPILVPDLSQSLDGHLADDWSPLTTGGTTVAQLRQLPEAGSVLAVGTTAAAAGKSLADGSGATCSTFDHLGGLAAADALVAALLECSDRPAPETLRHARRRLTDGLLDSHFVLGGARVAVAGEPEFLAGVSATLAETGARIVAAVAPTPDPVLSRVPCDEVVVGDLVDLEERAAEGGAELVVASSHARGLAGRLQVAHLVAGFPVYDRLGAHLRGTSGYRGSLQFLFDAANQLLEHRSSGHQSPGRHPNPREL